MADIEDFDSSVESSGPGKAGPNYARKSTSLTTIEDNQPTYTDSDDERVIEKLRQEGVIFESDSESEQENGGDSSDRPGRERTDAHWQPRKPQSPFEIEPLLDWKKHFANYGTLPPPHKERPSKKQLIGNLLKYQCRERRRRFGDPHQVVELDTRVTQVTAVVQRVSHDASGLPVVERGEKQMSFSEFIGMPEKPVVVRGKRKGELAYREGKDDLSRNPAGNARAASGRARRVVEGEKFPFVYKFENMRV